jgi:hypothetical protein
MERIVHFIEGARKFIVALGNALVVTGAALQDGGVSGDEIGLIMAAWVAAVGVYSITNKE